MSYDDYKEGNTNPFEELPDSGTIRKLRYEVTALQAQLAERDKTILEQQARIDELIKSLTDYNEEFTFVDDLSALEANDREVRIKCLEDAADKLRGNGFNVLYEIGLRDGSYLMAAEELEFMANELKEQS
jgi:predicted RNase H-like nuclease (RuvC/YqgF family)